MSVLAASADYFENTAASFQKIANSAAYRRDVSARAAILREAAHYLECAARLRGKPIAAISLKEQHQEHKRASAEYFKKRRRS